MDKKTKFHSLAKNKFHPNGKKKQISSIGMKFNNNEIFLHIVEYNMIISLNNFVNKNKSC